MTEISQENKSIAQKIVSAVGGSPSVKRFWDEGNEHYVDLLSLIDRPTKGVKTVASLGLSDSPLSFKGKEYPTRVEIVGACEMGEDFFENIISTASFNIIKEDWFCAPGVIYPNIVSMYYPDYAMSHLYFTTPFLWEDALSLMEMKTKKVAFLLGVPISEQERLYAIENSPVALENMFEKKDINIFSLRRESVL